jgi:hypothetical protein
MSRGRGIVQRRIIAAFDAEPSRRFSIEELASVVYPGKTIERSQREAVRRALQSIGPVIGVHRSRAGRLGTRGWHHIIGMG